MQYMKKLKQKKSPRPDGITNKIPINVGKSALYKLLEIVNQGFALHRSIALLGG